MSPLLVVFIFQIIVKLIDTIGADTLNEIIWLLFNKLPTTPTSDAAQQATQLRKEILRLKRELNSVSAQDDFARWAKLRRQHDKVEEDYKRLTDDLASLKASFNKTLNSIRWFGVTGLRFYIQWHYSRVPVYWLPKGWVPSYGEWLLSFPRAPLGSVSVQAWQLACGAVIAMVAEAIGALIVLLMGKPQAAKENEEKVKNKISIEIKKTS